MKKIILSVISVLMIFVMMPLAKAESKVPVYMFTKDGCSACISAHEYFDELANEYPDLFELVEIEVFDSEWNITSEDLQKILIETYEKFGEDTSKIATPTIVIGDYHTIGLPQDTSVVYDAIVAAKEEEKTDEIKKIAEDLNIDIEDVSKTTETPASEESGKYDALIIIGIFVVLIGGFAGLVIAGKK